MCGRYATTRTSVDLSTLFEAADETGDGLVPDYNVAPTDPAPIVRMSASAGGRVVSIARWGLVPPWAPDLRGGARMINARAETVETSKAYGPSFARRRCLVPADGWYEWLRLGVKQRQAYYMTPSDGQVLAFAGLWSVWGKAENRVLTCSIVTTAAMGDLAEVHDRMPLALPPDRWNSLPEWRFDPSVRRSETSTTMGRNCSPACPRCPSVAPGIPKKVPPISHSFRPVHPGLEPAELAV